MLYVPKLHVDLLLVTKLVLNGLKVQFNLNKCIIKFCNDKAIAFTSCERNLYEINFVMVHKAKAANLVQFPTGNDALELWHRHLAI